MAANAETKEFLDSIIQAHGGLDRWNRVDKVVCTYNFHGAVLDLKGHPGLHTPTVTISPHGKQTGLTTNFAVGGSTDRWLFTPDRVWIESSDGQVKSERTDPRSAFAGHALTTPWDDLHILYFIGYATYNYLTIPWLFTYPGFTTRELTPHVESADHRQTWRVLEVTHPEGFATHTRVQKFYFGARDFLLKRMDYTADVMGGVAAHYVFDYKRVHGLLFPTVRRVVRRGGEEGEDRPQLERHTSFWLQYADLRVVDRDGVVHARAERVVT